MLHLAATIGLIRVFNQFIMHNRVFSTNTANMEALLNTPDYSYDGCWFPDSGASSHVTSYSGNILHGAEYNGPEQLHMGNGKCLNIKRVGHTFVTSDFNPSVSLSLQNLLHVPSITINLVSVSKFANDDSVFFEFCSNYCLVKTQDTKETLLRGVVRPDGLYCFQNFHPKRASAVTTAPVCNTHTVSSSNTQNMSSSVQSKHYVVSSSFQLWHDRLGHPHTATVLSILKSCNVSLNKSVIDFCSPCCMAKAHKLSSSLSSTKHTKPLEMLFLDVWGPSPSKSIYGSLYYLSVIDAYS